jgi:hypothetical protein
MTCIDLFLGGEIMSDNEKEALDLVTQMVDGIAKRPEDAIDPADMRRIEEQRKRLAGRAMEYLMFLDDDDE